MVPFTLIRPAAIKLDHMHDPAEAFYMPTLGRKFHEVGLHAMSIPEQYGGGGIEDDIFVYRIAEARWLVAHNAANAAADFVRLSGACGAMARIPMIGRTESLNLATAAALMLYESLRGVRT